MAWGLLISAVAAAVVAGASSFMVNGSALFTRNMWRRYARPDATEAHYLAVGRVASVVVVALGVVAALALPSVIGGLELIWKLMAFMGLPFWAALVWPRANRWGAWAALGVTTACMLATSHLGWSFPDQVALYLPAGAVALVVVSWVTSPEPSQRLHAFYSLLNTPVGEEARLRAAGIEMIHEGPSADGSVAPAVHPPAERAVPNLSAAEDPPPPVLDDAPAARQGASLLLVNLLHLTKDFSVARYRVDLRGFGWAWGVVVGLLLLAYGVATWASGG